MLSGQMTFGGLTAIVHLVGQLQAPFVNLSGVMPQYVAMLVIWEHKQLTSRELGKKLYLPLDTVVTKEFPDPIDA